MSLNYPDEFGYGLHTSIGVVMLAFFMLTLVGSVGAYGGIVPAVIMSVPLVPIMCAAVLTITKNFKALK